MPDMRVLKVSDVHFPRVNGVSTSIETFRNTLPEYGVEVRLVVPRYGLEPEEAGVVRVPGRPVPRDPEDRLVRWHAMHHAVLHAAAECDIVHVQTPFVAHPAGVKAARALGLPVVATYHTLFEEYLHHYAPFLPGKWLRALARRISRGQCNDLDAVIVPSSAMRERLTEYGVTAPIHVLPTGIPLTRFDGGNRERFRQQHDIGPERPVALYVGRVAFEKNIGFLLKVMAEALKTRPDLLFLVTGGGPAVPDLKAQAKRLGIEEAVRFLGYLDRNTELQDCYAAADAFVFASLTETQGLVLLEAMAMGLPVVALAEMGTRDILGPGKGCIVPRHDVEDFARELVALLGDPARRKHLSLEAGHYAHSWSDAAMAGRLASLYSKLIDDSWKKAPTKEKPAYAA